MRKPIIGCVKPRPAVITRHRIDEFRPCGEMIGLVSGAGAGIDFRGVHGLIP
jgi:hypothetical protein